MQLSAFDLATRISGWATGDGQTLPTCGAWRFVQTGDDLGHLLDQFDQALQGHIEDYRPTEFCYEAPILVVNDARRGTDKLLTVRKIYSLGAHLEWVARRRGIPCSEVDLRAIKRELAGFSGAQKADMVAAAEKLGINLPQGPGKEDAADACAAWLLMLRLRSRSLAARFDRALWSARGAASLI